MRNVLIDGQENIERLIEQAVVLIALKKFDEAAHFFRLALVENPNNPECLLRLSALLMQLKCYEECFHHARHFIRLVNDVALGYFIAGYAAREIGRWKESRAYLLRSVELDQQHVYARVLCCMSVFNVCMDEIEAKSTLKTYESELDQLILTTSLETAEQIDNAVEGVGALPPFFLPYLGYNVTALQAKYGAWICSVMGAKYPQYSQPLPQRASKDRVKIGIISNYFQNHSHWKIAIKGWLEQLDRSIFSIHCFHTGDLCDDITDYARSISDTFLQSIDTHNVISAIYAKNLDVLIHSGVGMDTRTLKLAGLRLAPVQCTSWGHPLTTGMPTIDYFISSDLMEPTDGELHYTEKLIRLPNLSTYCKPIEHLADTLVEFAIPGERQGDVIFLCCQNLLKYLVQYDHVFPDIARKAGQVRFVFIASEIKELTERFMRRIDIAFQRRGLIAIDYVSFVPALNAERYAAINAKADIYLDSIGWSGGNTTLESLPFNKPIVTLPGAFMRGRHTYAILKRMGVSDTIATTVEEYVSISVRLAVDLEWREEISSRVAGSKHKIYRDDTCIKALETFLIDVSGSTFGVPYE